MTKNLYQKLGPPPLDPPGPTRTWSFWRRLCAATAGAGRELPAGSTVIGYHSDVLVEPDRWESDEPGSCPSPTGFQQRSVVLDRHMPAGPLPKCAGRMGLHHAVQRAVLTCALLATHCSEGDELGIVGRHDCLRVPDRTACSTRARPDRACQSFGSAGRHRGR